MAALIANPIRIYLIRHGETEWSLGHLHTGRTDIPLTENGRVEASELGKKLKAIEFNAVFTSPLSRARQTCALAGLGINAKVDERLREWDYGDYEGIRSAEIHITRPLWSIFNDGCPNGETPLAVAIRAELLISDLLQIGGNIALFTHGHIGASFAMRWLSLPLTHAQHFPLSTASISILNFDSRQPNVPICSVWNSK